jgi:co-chaperonin GroES (HSP10)
VVTFIEYLTGGQKRAIEIKIDGEDYLIMHQEDILGILDVK